MIDNFPMEIKERKKMAEMSTLCCWSFRETSNDCETTFSVNSFADGVKPSIAKDCRNGLGYIGGSTNLNGIFRNAPYS